MAQNGLKMNPAVDAIIHPIINEMTKIDTAQKSNPILGSHNEPDYVKEIKKKCVHIIYVNGEYRLATEKNADGDIVCRACGRKINTKFDETAVQTLTKSVEIVNQILLFGMLNGLRAEPINALIGLKLLLPGATQLLKELNDFVKQENKSSDGVGNIGSEYAIKNGFGGSGYTPITSYV